MKHHNELGAGKIATVPFDELVRGTPVFSLSGRLDRIKALGIEIVRNQLDASCVQLLTRCVSHRMAEARRRRVRDNRQRALRHA